MKKIFFLSLLLCFSSLVFGQKKGKPKAKTVRSEWFLVSDPYKKTKIIKTTVISKDKYSSKYDLVIKKVDDSYYWVMRDGEYLSDTQAKASIITVYVMIDGEMQEFLTYNGNPLRMTPQIFEAFKKGSMGSFQFGRDPTYYEFSLTGFNETLPLLD
jgi:hypothetical protein